MVVYVLQLERSSSHFVYDHNDLRVVPMYMYHRLVYQARPLSLLALDRPAIVRIRKKKNLLSTYVCCAHVLSHTRHAALLSILMYSVIAD